VAKNRNSLDFRKKFRELGVSKWPGTAVSLSTTYKRELDVWKKWQLQLALRINKDKTKFMKMKKTVSPQRVVLTKETIDEVGEFTYLGSVVSTTGGTDQDVEARLVKARLAFKAMDKLWTSQIFRRAK